MEIQLPTGGCNIFYGNYIDHYLNNTRRRYYINNNKLILNSTSTYSSMPSGYNCISQGDIHYNPELAIEFPFLAFGLVVFALLMVYKVIIKRLLP